MPVSLRKVASDSVLWASCPPWIFSAISAASTGPLRRKHRAVLPGQHRPVSADGFGETHNQGVGRQLVADRGLCRTRQRRYQWRQVMQVEVVSDIDGEPQFGGTVR